MTATVTTKTAARLRVYGLARVSTAEQDMARQLVDIHRICQRENLNMIELVEAPDVRGKDIAEHPSVFGLIRALETGAIDGVVVSELSRLVRPEDMDFGLARIIKEHRKLVWDTSGVLDANTSGGFWMTLLKGGMAGQEISYMRDRVGGAKEVQRQEGLHPGSHKSLPKLGLGFRRTGHKKGFWEYTPEAELIRRAYTMLVDENATYADIGRILGGKYTQNGIRILLRNRCWLGVRSYTTKKDVLSPETRSRKTGKKYRMKRMRKPEEVIEVPMGGENGKPLGALIPVGQWERAQEIIISRLGLWHTKQTPQNQLVAVRTLHCSCGAVIYHRIGNHGKKKSHPTYYCSTRHVAQRAKGIEPCGACTFRRSDFEATLARIVNEAFTLKFMLDAFRRMVASRAKAPSAARRIRAAITDLRAREKRLLELRLRGNIEYDDFHAEQTGVKAQMKALQETLPVELPLPDITPALGALAEAVTSLPSWSPEEKRTWYARAITSIVIENGVVTSLRIDGGFLADYIKSPDNLRSHTCTPSKFVGRDDLELTGRWRVAA